MAVAERLGGEIVSADSMQIYRDMDIGTAKPSKEDRENIPHHLIDIRNPDEDFDAAQYRDETSKAIAEIIKRRHLPIVTGGTGLYIKALTEGIFEAPGADKNLRNDLKKEAEQDGIAVLYKKLLKVDPEAAVRIGSTNTHRIIRALEVYYLTGRPISQYQEEHAFSERPYYSFKIGLRKEREALYKDIDARVDNMIRIGFIDEVKQLVEIGYRPELKAMQALGYGHICKYLKGEYTLDEVVRLLKRDTRHYAKRQATWFRRDHEITWHDLGKEAYIEHIFSEVRGFVG